MALPKYQLIDVPTKKALDELQALLPKLTDKQKEDIKSAT